MSLATDIAICRGAVGTCLVSHDVGGSLTSVLDALERLLAEKEAQAVNVRERFPVGTRVRMTLAGVKKFPVSPRAPVVVRTGVVLAYSPFWDGLRIRRDGQKSVNTWAPQWWEPAPADEQPTTETIP